MSIGDNYDSGFVYLGGKAAIDCMCMFVPMCERTPSAHMHVDK